MKAFKIHESLSSPKREGKAKNSNLKGATASLGRENADAVPRNKGKEALKSAKPKFGEKKAVDDEIEYAHRSEVTWQPPEHIRVLDELVDALKRGGSVAESLHFEAPKEPLQLRMDEDHELLRLDDSVLNDTADASGLPCFENISIEMMDDEDQAK